MYTGEWFAANKPVYTNCLIVLDNVSVNRCARDNNHFYYAQPRVPRTEIKKISSLDLCVYWSVWPSVIGSPHLFIQHFANDEAVRDAILLCPGGGGRFCY